MNFYLTSNESKHFSSYEEPIKQMIEDEIANSLISTGNVNLSRIIENMKKRAKKGVRMNNCVIKIIVIDENTKKKLSPIKLTVNLADENIKSKLCEYLHTQRILDSNLVEIEDFSRKNLSNQTLICFSKLPKDFKLHYNVSFQDHKMWDKWCKLFHVYMINKMSELISSFDKDEMKNTVNGINNNPFEELLLQEINNVKLYENLSPVFEGKEEPFDVLCEINHLDPEEEYKKIRDYYIEHIPLCLSLNFENYEKEMYRHFHRKAKHQYPKIITQQEKLDFWLDALNDFYNSKNTSQDHQYKSIVNKWMKDQTPKYKNVESINLDTNFINEHRKLLDFKGQEPSYLSILRGKEITNMLCNKTKMTMVPCKNHTDYLDKHTSVSLKVQKNKKPVVIVPKNNHSKEDLSILLDESNIRWDEDHFEMKNKENTFELYPETNLLKHYKNGKLEREFVVDEYLKDSKTYLIEDQ